MRSAIASMFWRRGNTSSRRKAYPERRLCQRVPLEDRIQYPPIIQEIRPQSRIMLDPCRRDLSPVIFQSGFHMPADLFQAGPKGIRSLRVRLQKIVPEVGAGNVNIGPDIVERMVLEEIPAPDQIIVAAETPQDAQRIDSGQSHDRKEPAKPNRESQAGLSGHSSPCYPRPCWSR